MFGLGGSNTHHLLSSVVFQIRFTTPVHKRRDSTKHITKHTEQHFIVVSCWILVIRVVMLFGWIGRCGSRSVRFLVWPMSGYINIAYVRTVGYTIHTFWLQLWCGESNFIEHHCLGSPLVWTISPLVLEVFSDWKKVNVRKILSPESQYEEIAVRFSSSSWSFHSFIWCSLWATTTDHEITGSIQLYCMASFLPSTYPRLNLVTIAQQIWLLNMQPLVLVVQCKPRLDDT